MSQMQDEYLVTQLRKRVISVNGQGHLPDSLCREAADEIERLRNGTKITSPQAAAIVIELLMTGNDSPNIEELSHNEVTDVLSVAMGMLHTATQTIGDLKGIPIEQFIKFMALNVARSGQ